jgi:hypothetical protein
LDRVARPPQSLSPAARLAHQTAGDTSPATRLLSPFAKAADPGRRLRTSPNGAITGATRSPQAKKHSDELTRPAGTTRTTLVRELAALADHGWDSAALREVKRWLLCANQPVSGDVPTKL